MTHRGMNPRAGHLKLTGVGLILCAILALLFGPVSVSPFGIRHSGGWSGADKFPYGMVFVVQCVGPSLVLMVLGFIAGCLLLIFSKPLSRDLARLPEITAAEKERLLNVAAATIAVYTLSLAVFGAVIEYGYVSLALYPGFQPLLRYATYVALIALLFFPFSKGASARWLLMGSGIALLFWAL